MRWAIVLLVILAMWMAVILYWMSAILHVFRPLPDRLLFGGFFLAIGITNVLFSKRSGRKFFAKTQIGPSFITRFWAYVGEQGVEVLFLGVGVIFAIAGCFVMIA